MREEIADWQLERYRLGELPRELHERVLRAAEADGAVRARLEALAGEDARVLAEHAPRVVAAGIRERLGASRRSRPFSLLPLASAAAVLVGLTLLLPRNDVPETRLKGLQPSLLVFRQADAGAEALRPAAVAHSDEVVQVAYQAADRRYGVVVSIDGRGRVTRHLPRAGEMAAPLKTGALVPLAEAYRLDDAPGFERFFLVAADQPFRVDAVVRAAEKVWGGNADPTQTGTRLELPPGFAQFPFELRKESVR